MNHRLFFSTFFCSFFHDFFAAEEEAVGTELLLQLRPKMRPLHSLSASSSNPGKCFRTSSKNVSAVNSESLQKRANKKSNNNKTKHQKSKPNIKTKNSQTSLSFLVFSHLSPSSLMLRTNTNHLQHLSQVVKTSSKIVVSRCTKTT